MSDLFEAYVTGEARSFFAGHFAAAEDRRRVVLRASRPLAADVAGALAAQNDALPPSPARAANVDALRRGAAAVVTGQQVGLFLGPLYTVYKAASAVRAARALAAESGRPVVPVFWLQTEDHDLPEIACCHVPCADGRPLTVELPASTAERVSIAHRTLPAEVEACLARLAAEIDHLPHAQAHLARLARHYRRGAGWSEAFAALLAELFAEEGLVLIDPRDAALQTAAAPIHRRALLEADSLAAALTERLGEIQSAGFTAPVHVRAGAPLSFFHPEGPYGPRFRLEPAAGALREVGGSRSQSLDGLLAALDEEPLRFSTSALLRPIVQDRLLPTAAYVGGPAEVSYFAQLAPLYAAFDLAMPLVVPRARLRLVDRKTSQALARLGLAASDAARPEAELLAAAHAGEHDASAREVLVRNLLTPLDAALDELRRDNDDLGVEAAFAKTRGTIETAVSRLAAKIEKAHHHRDRGRVAEIRRLQLFLHPNGVPQERFYALPYFAARYGERRFIERILAAIDPFDPTPLDLELRDDDPSPSPDPSIPRSLDPSIP